MKRGIGRRHGRFSPHPKPRSAAGGHRAPKGTDRCGWATSRKTAGLATAQKSRVERRSNVRESRLTAARTNRSVPTGVGR